MQTIPEIAEILRQHINTDNSAPRLIVEHILPLLGVEIDTVEELRNLSDTPDVMRGMADEVAFMRKSFTREIDAICARLAETEKELNDLSDTLEPETAEKLQEAANDIGCRIDDVNELRALGDELKDLAERMQY